jgi:cyclopropane fatty-acyl-phospholipid synthase-like methyltransferase
MIHRKVFDTIGLLNEEYGTGAGEDTEFCIEAERAGFSVHQAGYKEVKEGETSYSGSVPIWHKGEGTVHDVELVQDFETTFYKNGLLLAKKYNPNRYRELLNNNYERHVALNGDPVSKREAARYEWAQKSLRANDKVLEIGCSSGYGRQFLRSDIIYTGLDYDATIIEVAKEQNWRGESNTFIQADINTHEFGYYDVIIAFEVIEHLSNGLDVIEMLKQHCTLLLITVPHMEPPGFWGPHHKLHLLSEGDFTEFDIQYINHDGHLVERPTPDSINLMVCKYEN